MIKRVSILKIADLFICYANFTFGGGSATTAVLHRELVERKGWIDDSRFGLCFALSRLTPGTNLLAFCTGVGWILRGLTGAVVALLAASVPCAIIVVLITVGFDQISRNATWMIAIRGAMAAAVGITVVTCWTISKPYVKRTCWISPLMLVGLTFGAKVFLDVPSVQILIAAAIVGLLLPIKRS